MSRKKQIIISAIILFFALSFGIGIGIITWIIQDTPDISTYKGSSEATLIYSADGQLLTKLYNQNRIYVELERIPKHLQNAIIAIEDTNFYVHHGIDFWGIARAVVTNILEGRKVQGASTITQQLARNALLSLEKTYYRKIQEAYLALQFERLYTKPEILEMYLNEIFLGHSAYGIEAASLQYFNKHVWELDLSEAALIAGLPKAPNYYSPFNNPEEAIRRRNIVLYRMHELGYITNEEYQQAREQELDIRSSLPEQEELAPYFIRYVRDKLIDLFGAQMVYSGGLKVYTTLDPEMQKIAEQTVQEAIESKYIPTVERKNTADKLQPQLAVVSIDPKTGSIRAMVGGRGHDQFNRAVQAVRQPGSAFKPFVYTTAIKQGYSPAYIINDMPMLIEDDGEKIVWPQNFQNKYRGLVTLRTALKHSINVAAVKLLKEVGINNTIKTAEEMGISTFEKEDRNHDHLSLALGGLTRGVTPLEMASAYGIFANQGIWVEPVAITKVLDKHDREMYKAHPRKKIVLAEDVAYLMTSLLSSVTAPDGTGWRARLDRPLAGKTGTTNKYTDAWFVGYTPELVTSVWIGEDNNSPMEYNQKDENGNYLFPEGNGGKVISSEEAAQLWGQYMRRAVADMPVTDFNVPDNIVSREIDPVTGLLPNEYTPRTINEVFRKANVPEKVDDLHQEIVTVQIDRETGQLATPGCPEENIIERNYLIDSGIRVGPAKINFKMPDGDEEITGTYLADEGEPVQKTNQESGLPVVTETGQIEYERMPAEKCTLHQSEGGNFLNNIWNMFNGN